jgi:transposase
MVINGAMNGEIFLAYLEQCLAPTLKRGDIVVIDNLPAHKVLVGANLRYLSQFLRTSTPIETVFHRLKAVLRKVAEPTIGGVCKQIRSFIRSLEAGQCGRYFRHSGYAPL